LIEAVPKSTSAAAVGAIPVRFYFIPHNVVGAKIKSPNNARVET
jgi:hypothetical protein